MSWHPSPDALLELHFDEAPGLERQALNAHVAQCSACAALLGELRGVEHALAAGPDDAPPRDGLQRVLARVAQADPARARRAEWVRAAATSAAALLAAGWAVRAGAERLLAFGVVPASLAGSAAGDLVVLALAAAGVLGLGALFTLVLAPVLILESQGRS